MHLAHLWLFLIDWNMVFQENTFQAVIATDQMQTTALYIYGDMQWTGNEFSYSSTSQVCLINRAWIFKT